MTALLGQIGRREVDHDPPRRQCKAEPREGAPHPFAAFAHRLVAEADDDRAGLAVGELHLHLDPTRIDALKRDGDDLGDHVEQAPLSCRHTLAQAKTQRKNKDGTKMPRADHVVQT